MNKKDVKIINDWIDYIIPAWQLEKRSNNYSLSNAYALGMLKRLRNDIREYITDYFLSNNKLPAGKHNFPRNIGPDKQVDFDKVKEYFEYQSSQEKKSLNTKHKDTFDNEIYCHAKDLKTLCKEYSIYIHDNELRFKGTLIEGPEINLLELSGLELTYSDYKKIWEQDDSINERDLLIDHLYCGEFELHEVDDSPMHSDVYYEYYCGDFDDFIKHLREWITKLLDDEKKIKK